MTSAVLSGAARARARARAAGAGVGFSDFVRSRLSGRPTCLFCTEGREGSGSGQTGEADPGPDGLGNCENHPTPIRISRQYFTVT